MGRKSQRIKRARKEKGKWFIPTQKRKNKFIPTQFSEHQVFGYRSEEQLKKDGVWDIMPDWAKAKVRARDTEEWVKSFGKKRKSKLWKLDENEPIPY